MDGLSSYQILMTVDPVNGFYNTKIGASFCCCIHRCIVANVVINLHWLSWLLTRLKKAKLPEPTNRKDERE